MVQETIRWNYSGQGEVEFAHGFVLLVDLFVFTLTPYFAWITGLSSGEVEDPIGHK